jgi:type I restriction enzyme M protein
MITGEMKNRVDSIWDTIWTGGITSPITVLEQITYLMFMKLLDDNQLKAEANANVLGVPLKRKVFQDGICVISENPRIETEYRNLRWSVFHNFEPGEMLSNIVSQVLTFLGLIGVLVDPTTAGLNDSVRAMSYKEPYKDPPDNN